MMATGLFAVADSIDVAGCSLPLFGQGNLWIVDSVEDRDSIEVAQEIVAQSLSKTSPGQLEVIFFDDNLSGISAPFISANNGGRKIITTVHDQRDFADFVKYLRDHVQ